MGESKLTSTQFTAVVLDAIRQVAPRQADVSADTPLDRTGLDSLGLIEVMVHLEDRVGTIFDEGAVRQAVSEPDDPSSPSVGAFSQLLFRMADGDHGRGAT